MPGAKAESEHGSISRRQFLDMSGRVGAAFVLNDVLGGLGLRRVEKSGPPESLPLLTGYPLKARAVDSGGLPINSTDGTWPYFPPGMNSLVPVSSIDDPHLHFGNPIRFPSPKEEWLVYEPITARPTPCPLVDSLDKKPPLPPEKRPTSSFVYASVEQEKGEYRFQLRLSWLDKNREIRSTEVKQIDWNPIPVVDVLAIIAGNQYYAYEGNAGLAIVNLKNGDVSIVPFGQEKYYYDGTSFTTSDGDKSKRRIVREADGKIISIFEQDGRIVRETKLQDATYNPENHQDWQNSNYSPYVKDTSGVTVGTILSGFGLVQAGVPLTEGLPGSPDCKTTFTVLSLDGTKRQEVAGVLIGSVALADVNGDKYQEIISYDADNMLIIDPKTGEQNGFSLKEIINKNDILKTKGEDWSIGGMALFQVKDETVAFLTIRKPFFTESALLAVRINNKGIITDKRVVTDEQGNLIPSGYAPVGAVLKGENEIIIAAPGYEPLSPDDPEGTNRERIMTTARINFEQLWTEDSRAEQTEVIKLGTWQQGTASANSGAIRTYKRADNTLGAALVFSVRLIAPNQGPVAQAGTEEEIRAYDLSPILGGNQLSDEYATKSWNNKGGYNNTNALPLQEQPVKQPVKIDSYLPRIGG